MALDFYTSFLRPLLFGLSPETAHDLIMSVARSPLLMSKLLARSYAPLHSENTIVSGLKFRNRLGLAAGLDKNGVALRLWDAIGFSHAEIGTVTPLPQPGNQKPRLFRLKDDLALINRMGFNNEGAERIRNNILAGRKSVPSDFIIGVNIGKNKSTPVGSAVNDYLKCFEIMFDVADYFTVNVSSPNTPGLRQLQEEEFLPELLGSLRSLNEQLSESHKQNQKPLFLKISPDINENMIRSIFETCGANGILGITATNTTIARGELKSGIAEEGGLSGAPLKNLSDTVLQKLNELRKSSPYKPVLTGVGGVINREDYQRKILYGADLVQVYTGFVYRGPGMIRDLLEERT